MNYFVNYGRCGNLKEHKASILLSNKKSNIDFFISYNKLDKNWAEWIASTLEDNGYRVIIQAWDFKAGSNFVVEMQNATVKASKTIAVLSSNYLKENLTQPEWIAAFSQDPLGENRKLIPIRVEECDIEGVLPQLVYLDLFGLTEQQATESLLSEVSVERLKPKKKPDFPIRLNGGFQVENINQDKMSWKKHVFQPKPLQELITRAKVVIDTNVLLSVYLTRKNTTNFILEQLGEFSHQNRLFIPPIVAKEFSKNHMKLIEAMAKRAEDFNREFSLPSQKVSNVLGLLSNLEVYSRIVNIESKLESCIKEYHETLGEIQMAIKQFVDNDIILNKIYELLEKSCYYPDGLKDEDSLRKEALERYEYQIPPGYLDLHKTDNCSDYIIWASMLALNEDVIFISNDIKENWVVQKPVIRARRELIEEFYQYTKGKSFCFVRPEEFFALAKNKQITGIDLKS